MKTRTLIVLSAAISLSASAYFGSALAAMILAVGHALLYQGHVIEAKLNRILDHLRLSVTPADLD